ncbi:LOW QUALITY PROTEIN: hypothetical protein KIPB_004879 [Kipferlia bialata]|uniref:Uncharacterized protein n=1 Tax=Kipferlia bialata TaxID=797122 RepID=A0A9K3CV65_9EUKA|nr:LOW QUALITY PROTEIN: hypothetical protein KIPB_004879 [Kipferlia bialata]
MVLYPSVPWCLFALESNQRRASRSWDVLVADSVWNKWSRSLGHYNESSHLSLDIFMNSTLAHMGLML